MSEILKNRKLRRTTIDEVARAAGVSIKTVSRVTNNEPNVRESTRARVEEAIASLNYQPDPAARSLASRRTYLVGLLHDNPSASYLVNIQNGALRASRDVGYNLLLHPCTYRSPDLKDDIERMIRRTHVEGLVLTPPLSDLREVRELLDGLAVPYVCVAPADELPRDRSVHTNDAEISAEMVRYLHSLGHREIGFIVGHPDHGAVLLREQGYRRAMQELGLEIKPGHVIQGFNTFESAIQRAPELLRRDDRPTAIFASNDEMAAGVIHVAHNMQLDVPGEVSVAGFDDIALAQQLWPALTTVRQPVEEMAQAAMQLLLNRLTVAEEAPAQQDIPAELVIRDSTSPPR